MHSKSSFDSAAVLLEHSPCYIITVSQSVFAHIVQYLTVDERLLFLFHCFNSSNNSLWTPHCFHQDSVRLGINQHESTHTNKAACSFSQCSTLCLISTRRIHIQSTIMERIIHWILSNICPRSQQSYRRISLAFFHRRHSRIQHMKIVDDRSMSITQRFFDIVAHQSQISCLRIALQTLSITNNSSSSQLASASWTSLKLFNGLRHLHINSIPAHSVYKVLHDIVLYAPVSLECLDVRSIDDGQSLLKTGGLTKLFSDSRTMPNLRSLHINRVSESGLLQAVLFPSHSHCRPVQRLHMYSQINNLTESDSRVMLLGSTITDIGLYQTTKQIVKLRNNSFPPLSSSVRYLTLTLHWPVEYGEDSITDTGDEFVEAWVNQYRDQLESLSLVTDFVFSWEWLFPMTKLRTLKLDVVCLVLDFHRLCRAVPNLVNLFIRERGGIFPSSMQINEICNLGNLVANIKTIHLVNNKSNSFSDFRELTATINRYPLNFSCLRILRCDQYLHTIAYQCFIRQLSLVALSLEEICLNMEMTVDNVMRLSAFPSLRNIGCHSLHRTAPAVVLYHSMEYTEYDMSQAHQEDCYRGNQSIADWHELNSPMRVFRKDIVRAGLDGRSTYFLDLDKMQR